MSRVIRAAVLVVVTIVASLFTSTAPAHAANVAGCRGQVVSHSKSGGQVHLTYRLWCASTVNELHVTAQISGGPINDYVRGHNDCFNTYFCSVSMSMKDTTGSDIYTFVWLDGVWPSTMTYARDRTGNNVQCNGEMNCATAYAYY